MSLFTLRNLVSFWDALFERLIPANWKGPDLVEVQKVVRRLAEELAQARAVALQGSCRSAQIGQLAKAMAAAQGAMTNPEKTKTAEVKGKSKDGTPVSYTYAYADLAALVDSARTPLAANELAYIQALSFNDGTAYCVTELLHSSGEWIRTQLVYRSELKDVQALGSLFTYLRRYALGALLGLAPEQDDDAHQARGKRRFNQPQNPVRDQVGRPDPTDPNRIATKDEVANFLKTFWPLGEAKLGGHAEAEKWLREQDPNLHQCTYARLKELMAMIRAKRTEADDPQLRERIQASWAMMCDKKGLDVDVRHWWAQQHFGWVVDPAKGRASAVGTPLSQVKDATWSVQRLKPEAVEKIKQDYLHWLDDQRISAGAQ